MAYSLNILTKPLNFKTSLIIAIGLTLCKYFIGFPQNQLLEISLLILYYVSLSVCLVNILYVFVKKILVALKERKQNKAILHEKNTKKNLLKAFYLSKLNDFLPQDLTFVKFLYNLAKHKNNHNCRILSQEKDSMDIDQFGRIQTNIMQLIAQYHLANYYFIINFELLKFGNVCKITFDPTFHEVIDEMFRSN